MPTQKPHHSKQDYSTPVEFMEAVKAHHGVGEFTFDFAADKSNTKALWYWTEEVDSLSQPAELWAAKVDGGWGWLNPPFNDIRLWAQKCAEAGALGARIMLLVPAAVGSNWFRDCVHRTDARVLFLNGRLCFIEDWANTLDPATMKPGKTPDFYKHAPLYPKDCLLCLFGPVSLFGGTQYEVWDWRNKVLR